MTAAYEPPPVKYAQFDINIPKPNADVDITNLNACIKRSFEKAGVWDFVTNLIGMLNSLPVTTPRLSGKFVMRCFDELTTEVIFKSDDVLMDGSPNPQFYVTHKHTYLHCNTAKYWFIIQSVAPGWLIYAPTNTGTGLVNNSHNRDACSVEYILNMHKIITCHADYTKLFEMFPNVATCKRKEVQPLMLYPRVNLTMELDDDFIVYRDISQVELIHGGESYLTANAWTIQSLVLDRTKLPQLAAELFPNRNKVEIIDSPKDNFSILIVRDVSKEEVEDIFKNHHSKPH